MATVLIADDEANLRKVLCALLDKDGHETIAVADGTRALETLEDRDIDILITDLKMPGLGGMELLDTTRSRWPALPVIVMTAHGTIDTAVSALKKGAIDYITKPFDKEELRVAVRKGISARRGTQQPTAQGIEGRYRLTGQSTKMKELYAVLEKVAATPSTVLVTGESGTGKELVATALHENSDRKDKPFIKVNCAAIPKDLMESEFFGHEKGAFTGAVSSKPGRFELADGGTLFLDEIAEIPIEMQVKLRALQEGEFERVGGVKTNHVDVRLIAATNRNLLAEIQAGNFREDLFYRLNVVPIALPPLRERVEDVPLLVSAFIDKYNTRLGKSVKGLSDEAIEVLKAHPWPGNIRQLENVIERTLLFCDGERIEASDLPEEIRRPTPVPGTLMMPRPEVPAIDTKAGAASMKDIVRQATVELEKDLIIKALDETRGNVTRAAHLLGISRKGLQNKMKEFGLRDPEKS